MNVNEQKTLPLRQRQAQATRAAIVSAAQELFVEVGYTSATIKTIAERAGVAVSTVYAIFGSKRGILREVREAWHEQSHIREVLASGSRLTDAPARLDELASASRKQWETGSEVMAIYTAASAADPQAADELAQALTGRRNALGILAAGLQPYLKPEVSVQQAAAILQALCLSQVFDELVRQARWSPEAYERWLAAALKRELLDVDCLDWPSR